MITRVSVTQNRIGVYRVTLPFKGPVRGQYFFLRANPKVFICFVFLIISSGDSVYYFIEMIRLVVWKVPWLKPEWGYLR